MIRLDDMRLFACLARAGSLTAASRELGVPKQTLSRRLAELERSLGVELARRTTRALTLTTIGRAYAARCGEMVRIAESANRELLAGAESVAGTLRITADHTFGEAFLPALVTEFVDTHPEVELEVELGSRKVDLVDEGFDVAFRIGSPPDVGHLAATRLGPAELWTVASPAYIERHGRPTAPSDLEQHRLIALLPALQSARWPLRIDGNMRVIAVRARVRVNGLTMAHRAARAGLGVAHLPAFAVQEDVATSRLIRLLEAHTPEVGGIHIIYPHARLLAPTVRAFVEHAAAHYRTRATRVPGPAEATDSPSRRPHTRARAATGTGAKRSSHKSKRR